MEEYPFFCESPAMSSTYVDTGFEAEIAIFGGILGVVFEDERSSDATFPFFQLDYTRIAYFCLTTPTNVTYKIDAKTIRSRMRSPEWLDTFDVSSMDIIEKPPFFQHRLCALLNSTHIPRPDDKVLARHGQTSTSILNDEIARAGPFPAYFNPRLRRSRVCIIRSGGPGLTQ
ncbi:hypothetical protein C8R46DRAFT_1052447 [Mycena filopes]|nr:hypothetical protein C8R46DRAFT_1052447 [Mycena filopes]